MRRVLTVAALCSTMVLAACGQQDNEREQVQDTQIAAIMACMRDTSYSHARLGQCIDDWFDKNAEVDY